MTIRDLLNNGIEIQGCVDVQYWDDEKDTDVRLFKSDPRDAMVIFPDKILDNEIKYMWATTDAEDIAVMIIEVEIIDN